MILRRNQRPPIDLPTGTAEERAAACADIHADLEKEFKKVQGSLGYDYVYSRALVARWVKEDPAACSAWIGAMNSRGAWGDPSDAFARALPAQQALDLMENGWLDSNRRMALSDIAKATAERSPAELPGILSRLRKGEANSFLNAALYYAKPNDAAIWLQIAGSDEKLLASLADKWIVASPTPDHRVPSDRNPQQDAEMALAAAAGTPAEAFFRQRYEAAVLTGKVDETMARLPSEPAAAVAALEAIYREQGLGPDAVQKKIMETVTQRYEGTLGQWNRVEWDSSLQQAVLGTLPMRDALEGRLAAIDSGLPEMLRGSSRASTLRDAMAIEPATVIQLALDRGLESEGVAAAAQVARLSEAPMTVRGDILLALANHDLWTDGHNLPDAKTFALRYFHYDPEAAQSWRRSLPPAMATALQEVMR